jgi:hypothetical protein
MDNKLNLIQSMFSSLSTIGFCDSGDQFAVVCPYCSYGYVHMGHAHTMTGDEYESAHVHDIGVRGDVTIIPFSGECGHSWVVVLGFHKGNIFGDIVLTSDTSDKTRIGK